MDDLEEEVLSENEDNQSNQSSNSDTNDEIISDDEELDEEIKLDESEADEKLNVFDNPKSSYTKYDYEVEDLGENDFHKFNNELKKNHTLNYHNECLYKNFNEIKELSKITRNKDGIIVDELHKTMPLLTKYEKTKILGMRVKQLNSGSNPYVTYSEKIIDNYLIAQMELEQKKLPFIIQRPLPNNNFEYWKLQDLDLL
jgi:DNA-directed RNA polymerase I, II, and III subunit RPABC2|uniref:DNA-directed RNA polymerase n=1 Tax=viral metagenome TaxID=1070528 RepID=A0A6C0H5B8_9ZZZZ